MAVDYAPGCTILVFDTDTYAGNFERDLTAYLTGIVGDCERGHDQADLFKEQHPDKVKTFEDCVAQIPDDSGCYRPTSIWTTPGTDEYNSVAIFFTSAPRQPLINFMIARANEFRSLKPRHEGREKLFNITGVRLIKQEVLTKVLWSTSSGT